MSPVSPGECVPSRSRAPGLGVAVGSGCDRPPEAESAGADRVPPASPVVAGGGDLVGLTEFEPVVEAATWCEEVDIGQVVCAEVDDVVDVAHAGGDVAFDEGAADWRSGWWYSRATSIFGGAGEIQRSIIADKVLRLPQENRGKQK